MMFNLVLIQVEGGTPPLVLRSVDVGVDADVQRRRCRCRYTRRTVQMRRRYLLLVHK